MTGLKVAGVLSAINPDYFHTFGEPISELQHIGKDLRAQLAATAPRERGRGRAKTSPSAPRAGVPDGHQVRRHHGPPRQIMRRPWAWTTASSSCRHRLRLERMMADHGYSLDDIVEIQTKAGVGQRPCSNCKNFTDLVRSTCEPGKGARIFVKDEAANLAGAFKDRRASVSIHVAGEGLRGHDRGDVGQLRRRRRQPGGSRGLKSSSSRSLRQPQDRPARDRREASRCEA